MTTADLLTLLLRLEWQGSQVHYVCPSCQQSRMHGHRDTCQLASAIRALADLDTRVDGLS